LLFRGDHWRNGETRRCHGVYHPPATALPAIMIRGCDGSFVYDIQDFWPTPERDGMMSNRFLRSRGLMVPHRARRIKDRRVVAWLRCADSKVNPEEKIR
jgi:hypothetical protein